MKGNKINEETADCSLPFFLKKACIKNDAPLFLFEKFA